MTIASANTTTVLGRQPQATTTSSTLIVDRSAVRDESSLFSSSKSSKKELDKKEKRKKKLDDKSKEESKSKGKSKNKKGTIASANAPINSKTEKKPKLLVEELKLFQNNQLLNQQDPIEQLHQQLNELMRSDIDKSSQPGKRGNNQISNNLGSINNNYHQANEENNALNDTSKFIPTSQSVTNQNFNLFQSANNQHNFLDLNNNNLISETNLNGTNNSTVKKGVLWQQQQFEKIHQRLFSRWKKRYFILTTDYLVCFKRSSSKVGRSEMGKFLYKDVIKVNWLKPNKSDKGAIILQINGYQFNLFLWSKVNLDDWMFVLQESIDRYKLRKSCIVSSESQKSRIFANNSNPINHVAGSNNGASPHGGIILGDDLNENTVASKGLDINSDKPQKVSNQENEHGQRSGENKSFEFVDASARINKLGEHSTSTTNSNSSESGAGSGSRKGIESPSLNSSTNSSGKRGPKSQQSPVSNGGGKLNLKRNSVDLNDEKESSTNRPNVVVQDDHQRAQSIGRRNRKIAQASERMPSFRNILEHDSIETERKFGGANFEAGQMINGAADNDAPKTKGRPRESFQDDKSNQSATASARKNSGAFSSSDSNRSSRSNGDSSARGRPNGSDSGSPAKVNGSGQARRVSDEATDFVGRKLSNDDNFSARESLLEGVDDGPQKSPKQANERRNQSVSGPKSENSSKLSGKQRDKLIGNGSLERSGLIEEQNDDNKNEAANFAQTNNNGTFTKATASEIFKQNRKLKAEANGEGNGEADAGEAAKNVAMPSSRGNLIRRDDSWQSLVSLTKIAKPTQSSVAQRSLYAQHMMPEALGSEKNGCEQFMAPNPSIRHLINLESTITPSRGPLFRQQSIQGPPNHESKQNGKFVNQFQRAASSNSNRYQLSVRTAQEPPITYSYQKKLLQLQMLHNNTGNFRSSNGAGDDNDTYTIYGGTSTINHYGYSSMRSNLKSAASEFAFIRPSSSNYIQSTLPKKQAFHILENSNSNGDRDALDRKQHQAIRSSLILPKTSEPAFKQQQYILNENLNYLPRGEHEFLVNPTSGERLRTGQLEESFLAPPMRELPMKPGRKRQPADGNLPKSSSLTSSIASFFRRAFSRRSNRRNAKKRSKLTDQSCSSSVGALGDCYSSAAVPVAPSAFSTGSKSIDGGRNCNSGSNLNQQLHSRRTIDVIEAHSGQAKIELGEQIGLANGADIDQQQSRSGKPQARPLNALNQLGCSPLHKSNSISTTMGISHLAERASFLYDNEMLNSSSQSAALLGSPMIMRSTRISSANLTPILSRQQRAADSHEQQQQHHQLQQQFFMSPRNSRQEALLPRPSSIYGQPSMISSPLIAPATRDERILSNGNNFGAHRNSMHSQHFRDRSNQLIGGGGGSSNQDARIKHLMKSPFALDTTREVAEELSSPISEIQPKLGQKNDCTNFNTQYLRQGQQQGNNYHQRQAIVNPILQSPTMDNIYDNHPMLMRGKLINEGLAISQSHRDSHQDHLLLEQHQQHRASPFGRMGSSSTMQFLPSSPMMSRDSNSFIAATPSRSSIRSQFVNAIDKKPAAIVAPTSSERLMHQNQSSPTTTNHNKQLDYNHQLESHQEQTRSPMLSERLANQAHYQQSPLVSQKTRVSNKRDGLQATVFSAGVSSRQTYLGNQAVVNIAGAPGISLEPALAASLLRGTNINAYESTEPNSLDDQPKTFLVSTRLSKSMAYKNQLSKDNNSPEMDLEEQENIQQPQHSRSSSIKDDHSAQSRGTTSSFGRKSSTALSNNGTDDSKRFGDISSDSLNSHKNQKNRASQKQTDNRETKRRELSRDGRESSSDLITDASSNASGSLDKSADGEKRNWITSKLIEN